MDDDESSPSSESSIAGIATFRTVDISLARCSGSGRPFTRGGGEPLSEPPSLELGDPFTGEADEPLLMPLVPGLVPRLQVTAESDFDGVTLGLGETEALLAMPPLPRSAVARPPNLPPKAADIGTPV